MYKKKEAEWGINEYRATIRTFLHEFRRKHPGVALMIGAMPEIDLAVDDIADVEEPAVYVGGTPFTIGAIAMDMTLHLMGVDDEMGDTMMRDAVELALYGSPSDRYQRMWY